MLLYVLRDILCGMSYRPANTHYPQVVCHFCMHQPLDGRLEGSADKVQVRGAFDSFCTVHTPSLSLSLTDSLSHTLSLSHTHTTLTHSLTHSFTLSLTHAHTLSSSLMRPTQTGLQDECRVQGKKDCALSRGTGRRLGAACCVVLLAVVALRAQDLSGYGTATTGKLLCFAAEIFALIC